MLDAIMSKEKLEALRERGYDFDIQEVLLKGFRMWTATPMMSSAFVLFVLSLNLAFYFYINDFALVYSLLLAPPLYSGFYLVANKLSKGEQVIYPDFFRGFGFFVPVVSIWLIGQLLTALGLIALVLPGIYLAVGYSFSVLFSIFGGFDFWQSLEESRKLITVRWWKFLVFSLILVLINILAALPYGIGLVITLPVTFYATYAAFEDITKDALS